MASHLLGECPERGLDFARPSRRASLIAEKLFIYERRWHRRRMWYVYILRCADNSLYVGETNDVARRLTTHNDGRTSAYTATRRPVTLLYTEAVANRKEALKREQQIKRWTRRKKEALIACDRALLKRL
jgi:predicted GIY-YIG superfamily endonuclease